METRTGLTDVSPGPLNETVNITLQGNYTLRTAKIGVGSSTTEPGPRYLTTSEDTVVQPNEEFTVSVRDRFNNPVGDQNVTVTANGPVEDPSQRVDQSGEVTFTYNGSDEDVNVSIPGGGEEHRVIFRGEALNGGGDNGGGVDEEGNISIISATSQGGVPPGQGGDPPGQGGDPPGQGGDPPGQGGDPPGQGGNNINVKFTVNTTATDAEVRVESWSDSTLTDSITVKVAEQQPQTPQTVSVGRWNQADRIEAILYDEEGNVLDSDSYPI